MILSTREHRALGTLFGLLAEGLAEHELRERVGHALLDLLQADHYASFIWNAEQRRFGHGIWLNMDASNLARYDAWFQFHDPITLQLQARRHATPVSEVMPHAELRRTEFFNDFLARDGLHWGINLHAFAGGRALGDLRIWRGRQRREFEPHDKALLDLIEPAFVAALRRAQPVPAPAASGADLSPPLPFSLHPAGLRPLSLRPLSLREWQVAQAVAEGCTDKLIARQLGLAPSSVRTYLNRLFEKTGTQRRAALSAWVRSQGRAAGPTTR